MRGARLSHVGVWLLALGVGCGSGTTPRGSAAGAGAEAARAETADEEERAFAQTCEQPLASRLEAQRLHTVSRAQGRGDAEVSAALQSWYPRGRAGAARPIPDAGRAVVLEVIRRGVRVCGLADAVALTSELVQFQTIVASAPAETNPEHARMATFLSDYAQRAGLSFRVVGAHDAWEVELIGASRERSLAFVFHGDVVPVNEPPTPIALDAIPEGWSSPPFTAHVEEGRLYGRGTEDDKGPIAAGLVMLATLSHAGWAPAESIVLAIGTAEEEDWDGMRRYAEAVPHARHVVSIDSNFPVVAAESGFVAWGVRLPLASGARRRERLARFVSAHGGLFLTQVPDRAEALLVAATGASDAQTQDLERLCRDAIEAALETRRAEGFDATLEVTSHEGVPAMRIVARGRSSHSSVAEEGANAIWLLSDIVHRVAQSPLIAGSGVTQVLSLVHTHFDGDHHGERLGLRYDDELMGALLVAPTLLRTSDDGVVELGVNMRRPRGLEADAFRARLDAALATLRAAAPALTPIDDIYVGEPHVADTDSALVPTLMELWRAETGAADATPISIRGGTYARLFPGAVDFGPSLPGRPYTGHGADEYIELEALELTVRLLFESTLRLAP